MSSLPPHPPASASTVLGSSEISGGFMPQFAADPAQAIRARASLGAGPLPTPPASAPTTTSTATYLAEYKIIRRNGAVVPFEPSKISVAMMKAFIAVGGMPVAQSAAIRDKVEHLTQIAVAALQRRRPEGGAIHIEEIQDQVELALMRAGEHDVASAYIRYRERRHQERLARGEIAPPPSADSAHPIHIETPHGRRPLDLSALRTLIHSACTGLEDRVDAQHICDETMKNLYDGVTLEEVRKSTILSARQLIEQEPAYSRVTARLLLHSLRNEVLGEETPAERMALGYADYFPQAIQRGIAAGLLSPTLAQFDLVRLGAALEYQRDDQFDYLGLQTLYDRYFLHVDERRIELPQTFFMRVAMGLALNEIDREGRAIEFYQVLSRFDFMSSTPTLFNSGTLHSQLSSCYITTIGDDLAAIYDGLKENALLSKFAGGLGNDWTPVRAMGSRIKGTNGKSQGVVPFLKVVNDTAVAVNQGGKRKGAVCSYLETWHADIEEFLDLRKNTGDDRRRTHDMNTANWVPDLFMRRVMDNANWSLFSPSETPELHDTYGAAFELAYQRYEAMGERGELKIYKRIAAVDLWRKMLSMLFETGHPWIAFKDPCNLRSPQQHTGVVHSSNLCTEITLNTGADEIAVCNLGSVNLCNHMVCRADGTLGLDADRLATTVQTAMRMLDNVIDLNYYPVQKARTANLRHRPVGLGIMGFQDCLHQMQLPYASEAAVAFADLSMELIAYHAYYASTELAEERGRYPSYQGSLWSQGILPQDSIERLVAARGNDAQGKSLVQVDRSSQLDWAPVRERITHFGMRNSNCLAIAPTATIANIVGVSASIEPTFQNVFVKSNLSGEFTVINPYLVKDLKAHDLWDQVMIGDLKYFDGSLTRIDRVPADLRARYATAFEIDPGWLVECAARRQKWIDQAQSLNLYMAEASGRKLDELYKLAWLRGLKTTYYLRTLAATSAEKSTGQGGELNAVRSHAGQTEGPTLPYASSAGSKGLTPEISAFCVLDDPECEACQ